MSSSGRSHLVALVAAASVLVVGIAAAVAGTVRAVASAPQSYYLALGDSVAYGFQPAKARAGLPPSRFDTGYVDVFAARLRAIAPRIRVVNYACPGESTTTFVRAGCSGRGDVRGLHDPFEGAQLDAARTFLRAHPGRVSPITLTLGGNDVADVLFGRCKGDSACFRAQAPRAVAKLASRLASILRRLRAAAPAAEIVVTGVWNFDAADLRGTDSQFRALNRAIARAAAGAKARFADVFPAFNPRGNVARERARLCALTFLCSQQDPHPTNAGYRAIAAAVWAASGYARRS